MELLVRQHLIRLHQQQQRRPRVFRCSLIVQQPYEVYSDEELRARFRFGSRSIEFLEQLLGEDIRRTTERNQPVPVKMQILVALRFYATGHFFQVIGDLFRLHKNSPQSERTSSAKKGRFHRFSNRTRKYQRSDGRFRSHCELSERRGLCGRNTYPNFAPPPKKNTPLCVGRATTASMCKSCLTI